MLRKTLCVTLALGALLCATVGATHTPAAGAATHTPAAAYRFDNLRRAIASYTTMQRYFYTDDGTSLYREQYPAQQRDNLYSYEWPFSQATAATIDLSNMLVTFGRVRYHAAVQDRLAGLAHYYSASGLVPNKGITTTALQPSPPGYDSYVDPPLGGSGDKFYDDNAWVGLESAQHYLMTGDPSALDRAKAIFALATKGWDDNTAHPAPGGVFWTQASWSQDRNTVSNMPNAEVGLRLYQITHDAFYLTWATKMYDWVNTTLRDPSDGLYWDHITLSGQINQTKWSYNQGVPIGVNVLFYQVTGDPAYLRRAEQIADAALAYYGSDNRLDKQPAYFNSIFFKNLLLLYAADHNAAYVAAMQGYADRVWSTYRDPATGLFVFTPGTPTQLLEQAAMTQIYAVLAWAPFSYRTLY